MPGIGISGRELLVSESSGTATYGYGVHDDRDGDVGLTVEGPGDEPQTYYLDPLSAAALGARLIDASRRAMETRIAAGSDS